MFVIEKKDVPLHSLLRQSGCSAVGSALRSGRRGRAFESPHPDREDESDACLARLFIFSVITMEVKTEAVVLRSFKYGDNKLIVDLFTRSDGRVSFVVPLPKSGKGKIKKQFFQPLSQLTVEYDLRPRVQLQRLKEAGLAYPYVSIPFDMVKLSVSLFLSEFLCYALRGEQRNELLYRYIVDSLQWLDECREGMANFHLVFLMRLTRFLGFYPNLDDYEEGSCFDLRGSCFCPHPPLHRDFLAPDEARKISLMMRMNYQTMHLFRISRQERNRLLEVAVRYYAIHIPDFPELKSLEVLKSMFD